MALQVWLPFCQNMNNYGLTETTLTTQNGAIENRTGKILNSFKPTGNNVYTITVNNTIPLQAWSLAWWEKFDATKVNALSGTGYQWSILCQNEQNHQILGFIVPNAGKIPYIHNQRTINGTTNQAYLGGDIKFNDKTNALDNKWHHYVYTYDWENREQKFYIDGVFYKTVVTSENSPGSEYLKKIQLAETNIGPLFQDMRVYNHVLTASEVKRLAQPKGFHYLMNNFQTPLANPTNELPNTYQEVKYIETLVDGANINTNIIASQNLGVRMHIHSNGNNDSGNPIGTWSTGGYWGFYYANAQNYEIYWYGNGAHVGQCKKNTPYTVSLNYFNNKKFIVNGATLSTLDSSKTIENAKPIRLFAGADGGQPWTGRIGKVVFTNGTAVCNKLIPCYRKSDKIVGFYDIITNTFMVAATGTLFAGPLVKNLPNTYAPIPYLKSGSNQYIDTGVVPNDNQGLYWSLDCQYYDGGGTLNYCGNGSYNGSTWVKFDLKTATQVGFQCGAGGSETKITFPVGQSWEGRHTYIMDLFNGKCSIDNADTYSNLNTSGKTHNQSLWLFGVRQVNNGYSKIRLYSSFMSNNGQPIRDFRPAYRISDSAKGLYDLVNDTFYVSATSTAFDPGYYSKEYNGNGTTSCNAARQNAQISRVESPRYRQSMFFNNNILKTDYHTAYQANITYSAWVKLASKVNSGDTIIAMNRSYFGINANGLTVYNYGKTPNGWHSSSMILNTNTWYHLAVVWNDTHVIGYINGIEDFRVATTGNGENNTRGTDIGAETSTTNRSINGNISDLRYYPVALSADDIMELYQMGHIPS